MNKAEPLPMTPTLPPMAYTQFELAAKPTRSEIVAIVNRLVNNGIDTRHGVPQIDEPWHIAPKVGWCHDYAVTKQWLLSALGIASQLCECIAPDGEHHVVVLVDGVALDTLTDAIRPMAYRVVRTQALGNPDLWEAGDALA